jgi:hypothetical protein
MKTMTFLDCQHSPPSPPQRDHATSAESLLGSREHFVIVIGNATVLPPTKTLTELLPQPPSHHAYS